MSSLTPKQCVDEMRAFGRLIGRPAGSDEQPAPWTADGCPENGSLDETYWRVCSRTGVAWFSLTYERCLELLDSDTHIADASGGVWRSRLEGTVFDSDVYDAGVPWSPAAAEGRKDDAAKPRVSLLPIGVLREMGSVCALGGREEVFRVVHVDRACGLGLSRAAEYLLGALAVKKRCSRQQAVGDAVLAFECGAAKYGAENWRNVEAERYRDAAFRHVFMAEGDDPESGVDHLAHGLSSLMLLRALKKEAGE